MLKLLEQHQKELLFRELRINESKRNCVECQIPGRKPRILPLVGHREHTHGIEVPPVPIPNPFARARWTKLRVVTLEPLVHVEEINLLRPQQSREGLALNSFFVVGCFGRFNGGIELVRLGAPLCNDALDVL